MLVLAMLAGLAGCEDSVRFRLRLEWQRSPDAQSCPTNADDRYSCNAIPLTCDVRVRVRIIGAANGQPYYSECFTIQSDGDACLLADLPITPRAVPNEMVQVQVIVWTIDELQRSGVDLSQTDGCPVTTEFTSGGLPRLGEDPTGEDPPDQPVPALGGEAYFAVGDDPVATVTLGCARWDSLGAEACRASSIRLEATIRDPRTFSSVPRSQAEDMDVRFGAPVANGDGSYRIDSGLLSPALAYTGSGALTWQGSLAMAPTGTQCLRIDALGVAAPTIACFPVAVVGQILRTDGFLVGRVMLRALLDLQALADVPEAGMVLGVVVDAAGQPVRDAVVTTTEGATVVYPADDLLTVGFVDTDTKGYFLSMNADYDSAWQASVPGGLMGDGSARGGLIDDHVAVVVVRLTGVVQPPLDAGFSGPEVDAGVDAP